MASEITINCSLEVTNGTMTDIMEASQLSRNQTTARKACGTWMVGTSAENLSSGDLSSGRYIMMRNRGPTNFVTIGMSDAGTQKTLIKLLVNDVALFPVAPSTTIRGTADTAECAVDYLWLDL